MNGTFSLTAASVADKPQIDIVFIHGLGGTASESWTHRSRSGQVVFWPSLIGEVFPAASVSLLGYPTAKLGKLLGGNDMGLLTAAAGVVDRLLSHGVGRRPIFFVAHSLGGIVVKAALRQCSDSSDPAKGELFKNSHGIVFFGTPHSGASMAAICEHLPGFVSMQSAELARADSVLMDLGQWFRGKAGPEKIRVHAFYETEKLGGLLIVDAASANPNVEGCDPVPLTENHVSMTKLPSTNHAAFASVRSFIASAAKSRGLDTGADLNDPDFLPPPPRLKQTYIDRLFTSGELRHTNAAVVDEREVYVDPNIYHENAKTRLTSLEQLLTTLIDTEVAILSGNDRAGKTLLTKLIQAFFDERGHPTIRIEGRQILNADIVGLITRATKAQYDSDEIPNRLRVVIDDFDECQLPDAVKERIVTDILNRFDSLVITAFTHAPSVLFAPTDLPDPDLFELSPLGDERLIELVQKWRRLGRSDGTFDEHNELATYELIQKIFIQTELEKYPGSAVSFLQLIDSSTGTDINYSSYAACYETLISSHISKIRPSWQNLDEAKNFIAFLAFSAYLESHSPTLSSSTFDSCLQHYANNFLSSSKDLREIALSGFLVERDEGNYKFRQEYEWYFLCARHAAITLRSGQDYDNFVVECTSNIFQKQYANMVVFMAYFGQSDNLVLSLLLDILDGLFSAAPSWTLSDESKVMMLGLTSADQLAISSKSDTSETRAMMLRERVKDIIADAEDLVAQYALPFINPNIDDSEYIKKLDVESLGADSYMKSINALMRLHSVIGQILASRSGTFDAKTIMDCITRMVMASGRYIALNHAIAAVLVHDRVRSLDEVDRAYDSKLSKEEKLDKVERIFSFWSVFISQAGLARYLSNDHAIRALKMLAGRHENPENYKKGHLPFNFTSVLVIASLYRNGELEQDLFAKTIEKYGDKSAIVALLRAAVHFYSYYLPLSIQDKQWLGAKLHMQVRRIETQRRMAVFAGRVPPVSQKQKKPRKKRPRPWSGRR